MDTSEGSKSKLLKTENNIANKQKTPKVTSARAVSYHEMADDRLLQKRTQLQRELLASLKEDLSDWIKEMIGSHINLSADNFIHDLDTGTILCQICLKIEQQASICAQQGTYTQPLPSYKIYCNKHARSGSWFARDNTTHFLNWCRAYGMIEEALFDTEDLVTHHKEKNVIDCLMELARIGVRFGLKPPRFISLEQELQHELSLTSVTSLDDLFLSPASVSSEDLNVSLHSDSSLHTQVDRLSKAYKTENKVHKITEGQYLVYGKKMLIRLCRNKQLMVRIGGGWETFESYLMSHAPILSSDDSCETVQQSKSYFIHRTSNSSMVRGKKKAKLFSKSFQ
ncbi:growth arrest-specific protein 2-like [Physella acuta]|uniref:growth arrest-specific protein 2-like n=1 Tax=Physella acuta TaxID=109671 RepID=UPI0027DCD9E6|nr:growth arrest-specific protein 2-like [Physella acuta]XP_059149552.1 growth arrest-specific protein 2-like [Physella acuta]